MLHLLESPHPFYQRQALRVALRGAPIPVTGRARLRAADRETRELARQVLDKN